MDRRLVEQAQAGDREAYEELARGAAPRLFRIASRILRDADGAEDAVQAALVAIWRDLPSLRDPDRFDAWTYRVLVHACRSELRRHRRLDGHVSSLSEDLPAMADPIRDLVLRDALDRAFRSLSHDHRVIVVLHHHVGLSHGEIADILDIPYGTVGSRLHHAMRSMRASIEAGERTTVNGGQPA